VLLAFVSLGAVTGFTRVNIGEAEQIEAEMYDARVKAHMINPDEHKLWTPTHDESPATAQAVDGGEGGKSAGGASETAAEPNSDQ
jgi:hypothetical protein